MHHVNNNITLGIHLAIIIGQRTACSESCTPGHGVALLQAGFEHQLVLCQQLQLLHGCTLLQLMTNLRMDQEGDKEGGLQCDRK